jgi:chromosome segregation ATPase
MDEYELRKLVDSKENLIRLKDEQVQTLENSLKWKDEQVKTLESSLKIKDEKAKTLEKTIELKEDEIRKLMAASVNRNTLNEKDEKISELKKELEILNDELAKADEDLESLELENEKLRKKDSSSTDNIIEFTNVKINKTEILEKMREMLPNAMSNVTIVVPGIEDLQNLYLYEVRSSVAMNIACSINPSIDEHSELLQEFESLDNISIKNYEQKDRYGIVRDAEELLIAVIGTSELNHLVFHTKDPKHIRLLNSLITESWIRSRKI